MQKLRQSAILRGKQLGLAGTALVLFVNQAMAAIPAEATAAFTSLGEDSTAMIALVWGVLGGVTGAFVLMKLFKKGASRAV